jgi:hypothetical protein
MAYLFGGGMGLLLLVLRVGVHESPLFATLAQTRARRGDIRIFFRHAALAKKALHMVAIGLPVSFLVGIVVAFAPEIALASGVPGISVAGATSHYTWGLMVGEIGSCLMSQVLRSRKRVMGAALLSLAACIPILVLFQPRTGAAVHWLFFALGALGGYWVLYLASASEQFGTDVRATAVSSIPTLVRGAVVFTSVLFRIGTERLGILPTVMALGGLTLALALLGLRKIEESYSRDLAFLERAGS